MCHAETMNFFFFLQFAHRLKLSKKKPGVSEDGSAFEPSYLLKVLGDGWSPPQKNKKNETGSVKEALWRADPTKFLQLVSQNPRQWRLCATLAGGTI